MAPPPSRTGLWLALGSVVVVVVVVVLILVLALGGSGPKPATTNFPIPADPAVVNAVTSVSPSVSAAVGNGGSAVSPPKVAKGNPPLLIDGKPGAVFVGGEFCPYCAAERWAMVLAFSRFGQWSNLLFTASSAYDTDPSTNTFTFRSATYTSPQVAFDFSEHYGNDTTGLGTGRNVAPNPLTAMEANLYNTYESRYGQVGSVPFLDVGNQFLFLSPSYDPAVLQGLDWQSIAAKLTNASDPVTQAIVGSANYITAALCAIDQQAPTKVCTDPGVQKAASAMGNG